MNFIKSLQQVKKYKSKLLPSSTHQSLQKTLKLFKVNKAGTHLEHTYNFPNSSYPFIVEKMNRIGLIADSIDHHPEWSLSGDLLKVGLSTHDIGNNISLKDYILATWIQRILKEKTLEQAFTEQWNNKKVDIPDI